MKNKRLLTRAKLGIVDSILGLAAWINRLFSEQRHNPYRCSTCGSTDVLTRVWVMPNKGSRYVENCIDSAICDDWCNSCNQYARIRPTDVLLAKAEEWWGETDFRDMERVTGYYQLDFDPEDGYQAFVDTCNEWWDGETTDDKITIYLNNQ